MSSLSSPPKIVERTSLRPGNAGVAQAIQRMTQLAKGRTPAGDESAWIRKLALDITRGASDANGKVKAVFDWVKQNIRFIGELDETLQSPMATVNFGAGDCDDHATLLSGLLQSIGFEARFKTVAADADDPNQFTHVYAEVNVPGRGWTSLDTTVKTSTLGWQPKQVSRSRTWGTQGEKAMGEMALGRYTTAAIRRRTRGMGSLAGLLDGVAASGVASGDYSDNALSQIIAQIGAPIAQGLANKITYGNRSSLTTLGVGNPFSPSGSSFPTWLILLGGAALLMSVSRR